MKSKASVRLVEPEKIGGFAVIETSEPVMRPDGTIPMDLLQRAQVYSCSQRLAEKWLEAVIFLRTRSQRGWTLDEQVERKVNT